MLASLSTAAGDVAADGDAPFRELRKGWMKRSGVGEELEHFAKHLKGPFSGVKAPSKASGDDSKAHPVVASSAGGISGNEKTEDCLNFLAPNETSNTDKTQSAFGLPKNTSVFSGKERDREAAAADAAALAVKLLGDKTGDEALAKSSETGALKRLQREAFADLLKVRERLDKLEHHTGLRRSKAASGEDSTGPAKTHLKGEVNAGTAFVLMEDNSSRCSRAAIVQAGLHTGLDIRFTFETPFREKDLLLTQCTAGNSGSDRSILGGPISITKIIYSAHVTDDLTVMVAPLGAHGSDMTEIVNPLQGQALTEFARAGPALYNHCYGSALGATLKGNSSALSVSQYLSDWGSGSSLSPDSSSNGLLCLSTLAQILFQPWENSVFSLSAVNRFWPSPPLPSSSGLHWSEMGALVLAKSMRSRRTSTSSANLGSPRSLRNSLDNPLDLSANASWGTPLADADRGSLAFPENQGTAMQSVAVAGEIDVGANLSLGGWVQVERGDWLQEVDKKNKRWAVSLARSSGVDVDWGICCGSSKIDLLSVGRTEDNDFPGCSDGGDGIGEEWGSQLQIEAFMKLRCGHGFSLQPGLVYLLNKQSQTPAFMLRASWTL
ncbi:unnamed protein product [Sphagnum jensenii]|uniref:Uncharacterized protein n=1 Tax=Sphagnum jensenii TaxID=128206 RepID=A0ABP1BWY7_9BRYO